MVYMSGLAGADGTGDHRPHTGVQAHARRYYHHELALRDAQPRYRLESDAAGPDEIRDLIDDSEEALGYLRPSQKPEILAYAALGQVPSGIIGTSTTSALRRFGCGRTRCIMGSSKASRRRIWLRCRRFIYHTDRIPTPTRRRRLSDALGQTISPWT